MRPLKFRIKDHDDYTYVDLRGGLHADKQIEQFTGEYDKEGKEIYEGDTLRWVKSTGMAIEKTVEWSQDYDQFSVGGYTLAGVVSSGCRVIIR